MINNRRRMRRKIRIRRVDNYNCCCYLVCALALLHFACINNIINFDNIVPGRAIFVDGSATGPAATTTATTTATAAATATTTTSFLRGGPQRQRQHLSQLHYYDDYVVDGSKDDDNKDKILLNTAIIFANKEENLRKENDDNNNDEETTSASSSPSFYDELLVKMTNENGVWRKQWQQNQFLTSYQQQQEQQHRKIQDTFPEEVDHDDDFYGNSSNITNGTIDKEGEDEDETFTTSTTTSTTTTRTIPVLTRGIIAGLGISAYLVSIGSCIFVYVYRTHKSVAIGQPPFLYLICFGCILLSSQIYFYIITNSADHIIDDIVVVDDTNNSNTTTTTTTTDNTPTVVVSNEDNNNNDTNQHPSYLDATCVGELWFDNVGIILIYMSLFCKLWRAYKVTRFRRNVKILPKHVIYPFVVILAAVIALTIAQTILDPPRWVLQEFTDVTDFLPPSNGTGTGSTTTTTFGVCRTHYQIEEDGIEFFFNDTEPTITTYDDSDSDSARYGWIPASITWLQAISFLIVLGMAFILRNIPEDISDSRNVCHALCANCCCAGSLITIWAIGYALKNLTIMVSSRGLRKSFEVYALIGYLIFPKIYAVCYEKKYGHLPPPRQPRRQRWRCTRNRNTSTVVVGVRGQTHISGVTLPTAVPRPKNTKKRRTLATMIMSAFSSVNNDDADDDDDNNNVATGINGCDAAVNGGNVNDDDDDDDVDDGASSNKSCNFITAAVTSGIEEEHLEREHKSSSSSILEEENNVSLSLSQSPSPLPSLKDSDAVVIIVSEDGIPLKMEDDDDNDNYEYDNNNRADDDDEVNWIFP
jgi:hypothetical protein